MTSPSIVAGSFGVAIELTFYEFDAAGEKVPVDISGKVVTFRFDPPWNVPGDSFNRTATVTDGPAGAATYALVSADTEFQAAGTAWRVQGIATSSGEEIRSEVVAFNVLPSIPTPSP